MYIKIVIYASRKLTIFILKSQKIHFTKYMQKKQIIFFLQKSSGDPNISRQKTTRGILKSYARRGILSKINFIMYVFGRDLIHFICALSPDVLPNHRKVRFKGIFYLYSD